MLESFFAIFMVSVWAFALVIGINPVLGARIGLWLQGERLVEDDDTPAQPVAPSPPKPPNQEHLGNNIDRFV